MSWRSAFLTIAFILSCVLSGQLDYDTWTAIAGSTIWCKFFICFALSRQAHTLPLKKAGA